MYITIIPISRSIRNKYGESQFRVSVLELTGMDDVLRAEVWIEKTQCAERRTGFNIFDMAELPGPEKHLHGYGKGLLILMEM